MKEIVEYIIQFLLGKANAHLLKQIAYKDHSTASIVIVPSHFFDDSIYMTKASMPRLPLKEIDGVPILFGEGQVIRKDGQIIVSADIIASTYFLITRYEECVNRENRGIYGNFAGRESLPYKAGFLMRPIVDEYGKLLRSLLRELGFSVEEPSVGYEHVYLTHDVDQIWQWDNLYRAFRTFIKRCLLGKKNILESFKSCYNYEKYDSIYTFPWIAELDQNVVKRMEKDNCTSLYFLKAGGTSIYDNLYYKKIAQTKKLISFLKEKGAVIGLHASFSAGENPQKIMEEKKKLEEILGEEIKCNRNHYLCSRNPEDMRFLIDAGITDDFTMGYADVAGFRLGTCRAVKWIDPLLKKITSLTLHPLTVMECTLDSKEYMNLSEEEAYQVICKLLDIIKKFHGEVVLLWHNSAVAISKSSYQRKMYEKTLEKLRL